jgi:hypothetical protein
VKFGVNVLRLQNNIVNDNYDIGLWTFNGQFTGDGIADLLLGWSSQWQGSIQDNVNLRGWLPRSRATARDHPPMAEPDGSDRQRTKAITGGQPRRDRGVDCGIR